MEVVSRRHWSITTSSQETSKHWTINTYKLTYVGQTVPWVLSNVSLDSASDTREGQAGQRGIMNYGLIPGVQYVALFTAGFD